MRLHALDVDVDRLAMLAESSAAADQDRVKQFVSFAWASLAGLPEETILKGSGWPSLKSKARGMPRLEKARAALNSYVHPNYGNDIAALSPERGSAARILLEAIVEIYEAFFALSWSEKQITGTTLPLGVGASVPGSAQPSPCPIHCGNSLHGGNDGFAEVRRRRPLPNGL